MCIGKGCRSSQMADVTGLVIYGVVNINLDVWIRCVRIWNQIGLIKSSHVMTTLTPLWIMGEIHGGLGEHLTGGKQKKQKEE